MAAPASSLVRVTVDGKFFRLGHRKFYLKGVTYGPFAPSGGEGTFANPEQTRRDFAQIRELGANCVRVYYVPPVWLLDLAAEHELRILVDIPWNKHLCFLDSAGRRAEARAAIRDAVLACARHPSVLAFLVANEIPPDIVRWSGAGPVADFIDELVAVAKEADPECLCAFSSYPSTEFLRPQAVDFLCFNVYLHHRLPFKNYLARLQMIADTKPLVLGEFGVDSGREGEERKCEMLAWQIETAFRAGLAGTVVFSFTDDWWRGGRIVEDWTMGLTTRERQPKDSFAVVQKMFRLAPYFPLARYPRVSIIVATYEGGRTLPACLDSLERLNYPDYEVILIDDGSTDDTQRVLLSHPRVRAFRHEKNLGLSTARNTGIAAATGEVIAFTDSDCRADEDWLYYLVGDLRDGDFIGIGGHNLPPPEDSSVAAAVLVSPGGPAHVMLTDRQAEHVPGCNMAFYKWALEEIHNFDPIFWRAGDDVDLCWRLQQRGFKIGFSPAGFVWHYRRSTIRAYLKQQHGYGQAEALLVRKHPERFSALGGSIWHGRIYTASKYGIIMRRPIVYHGSFASGMFQTLYTAQPVGLLSVFSSIEYHVLVTLPLLVLSAAFDWLAPIALACLGLSLGVCLVAGAQAELPPRKRRWWSRPVVALLYFLQPIVRGWARYQGQLAATSASSVVRPSLDSLAVRNRGGRLDVVRYWSSRYVDRIAFISGLLDELNRRGWPCKTDIGWSGHDVEIFGHRWTRLQITTVAEDLPQGARTLYCRLRSQWTLRARAVFWSTLGFELLLCSFLAHWLPWIWLLLLTMPAFIWLMVWEKRNLRSIMVVFLDEYARRWQLVKMPADGQPAAAPKAAPPASAPTKTEIESA